MDSEGEDNMRGGAKIFRASTVGAMTLLAFAVAGPIARGAAVSDKPETPFKLATFEIQGKIRIGLVFESRVVDLAGANAYLVQKAKVPTVKLPGEMRELIEQYDTVSPRLYQIANYLKGESERGWHSRSTWPRYRLKRRSSISWNLLNIAANYKAHAEGMGAAQAHLHLKELQPAGVVDSTLPWRRRSTPIAMGRWFSPNRRVPAS